MTTIKLKINTCQECPHFEEGYPQSTDGFDSGNDWFCKMANDKKTGKKKLIAGFVEWHEVKKVPVPKWCPIKVKR